MSDDKLGTCDFNIGDCVVLMDAYSGGDVPVGTFGRVVNYSRLGKGHKVIEFRTPRGRISRSSWACYFWRKATLEELKAQFLPLPGAPTTGQKLPIDRPCSACSDGDTEMKYHDHQPPFRDPVLNDKAPEMPKQSEPFVSGMGQDEACPEVYRFGLVRIICRLKKGHPGEHQASNMAWPDPAPNVTTAPLKPEDFFVRTQEIPVTTAPEEAAARETQSAEPTVEDALRCIRKMEQCTGDTAKVLLIKNLFRRFASAREAQIAELLARLDAIADLATTDSGPVQPRPQDKVQK